MTIPSHNKNKIKLLCYRCSKLLLLKIGISVLILKTISIRYLYRNSSSSVKNDTGREVE